MVVLFNDLMAVFGLVAPKVAIANPAKLNVTNSLCFMFVSYLYIRLELHLIIYRLFYTLLYIGISLSILYAYMLPVASAKQLQIYEN